MCPGGGIGIRVRLRSVCRKTWEFESPPGHHKTKERPCGSFLFVCLPIRCLAVAGHFSILLSSPSKDFAPAPVFCLAAELPARGQVRAWSLFPALSNYRQCGHGRRDSVFHQKQKCPACTPRHMLLLSPEFRPANMGNSARVPRQTPSFFQTNHRCIRLHHLNLFRRAGHLLAQIALAVPPGALYRPVHTGSGCT